MWGETMGFLNFRGLFEAIFGKRPASGSNLLAFRLLSSYDSSFMNYIKAEFGLDNEDAEKFRAVYERLKVSLAMSSDYVGGEV